MKDATLKGAPAEVLDAFKRLTDKQRAFALAVPLVDTLVEAAVLAGYAKVTAQKKAFSMANLPDIRAVTDYLVGKFHAPVIEDAKDSVDRMLAELHRLAYVDMRMIYDDNGALLPIKEWPEDVARAVSSIDCYEEYAAIGENKERVAIGRVTKVRFVGKTDAIDKVSKIKGYYRPERHELSGPNGRPMLALYRDVSGTAFPIARDEDIT